LSRRLVCKEWGSKSVQTFRCEEEGPPLVPRGAQLSNSPKSPSGHRVCYLSRDSQRFFHQPPSLRLVVGAILLFLPFVALLGLDRESGDRARLQAA